MYETGNRWKRKACAVFLLLIGTGCVFGISTLKHDLAQGLYQSAVDKLLWTGFGESDVLYYVRQNVLDKDETYPYPSFSLLSYLSKNQEELAARESRDVSRFALIYPGKSSAGRVWSAAAGNMGRGEEWILARLEEENGIMDAGEASAAVELDADSETARAVMAENQAYLSQEKETAHEKQVSAKENEKKISRLENTMSLSYLLQNFYIVDSSTSIDKKIFDVDALLHTGLALKKNSEPQILIFHTHGASEHFIDSDPDKLSESVVGVGGYLAKILEDKYGYQVIHDETCYDMINGQIDRNKAYNKAYDGLKKTLKKYPSIQVVIDLHRDGVGAHVHRIAAVNGKRTAQVMFFNGLSRNRKEPIQYLKNDNLQANLAFSLQMKLASMKMYPGFAKPVYLKSYRYNLHLRRRSLLIELGNENNTLQEARNAMEPLADVLNEVLSGN